MRLALLVFLFSAALHAGERTDALDFSNGTVLLEDGGSYATGFADWSAYRLTDGSDVGWCSPEGKALGLSFVWELDTVWRLDTFGLSTKSLQEGGYPGISVKTVELYLAGDDDGAWKSAGRFDIGKEDAKEWKLPAGTQARRVKLTIVANGGNPQYTEIAEVDLYGERVKAVPTVKVDGDYKTDYGPLRFVQDGNDLYGCYDWADGALIWGSISGRTAQVTWWERRDQSVTQGPATFSVSATGIDGIWFHEGGSIGGRWSGQRVPASEGPKCKPAKKPHLGQDLKSQGRVVLYGIRFDVGSDVPLADSAQTLDELAAALAAEPSLAVEVAGHTDATAGDAYNLDLSNRRAKSVVAALVKKGIAAKRLSAKGYGREKPIADNATAQGRALNRRVEVTVVH